MNSLAMQQLGLTSFIGRSQELDALEALLTKARLVTLSGPGGTGKTRLALELAARLLPHYPDGVRMVELADLTTTDPRLLEARLAQALGMSETAGSKEPLLNQLVAYLKSHQLLLILDNCEHLLDPCARLVESLLSHCPHLQIVTTSRENLGIGGEIVRQLEPLGLPPTDWLANLSDLDRYEATRLFCDRLQTNLPSFVIREEHIEPIVRICRRLDGLPLALELAATLAKTVGLAQIVARLEDRLNLLSGGPRSLPPRHQALRTLFDWSYELLSAAEQALFRQLGVFAGSFSLEAVEAICQGDSGPATGWIGIELAALVNKSLVIAQSQDGLTMRYRLLETIRQYAWEKLAGESQKLALQQRHLDWFVALAGWAEPHLKGPEQQHWLDVLDQEQNNLRAALNWSLNEVASPVQGLQLCAGLGWFWYIRGHWSEGRYWLAQSLLEVRENDPPSPALFKVYNQAGILAKNQGDYQAAIKFYRQAFQVATALDDKTSAANVLNNLAIAVETTGDYQTAVRIHRQSLGLRKELQDRQGMASSWSNLANIAQKLGKYRLARRWHSRGLQASRTLGDRRGIAISLYNLGQLAQYFEEYEEAKTLLQESLTLHRELKDKFGCANALLNLGYIAHNQKQTEEANAYYWLSLEASQELRNARIIGWSLGGLAALSGEKTPELAARLFGAAQSWRELAGTEVEAPNRPRYDCALSLVQNRLGEALFAARLAEGAGLPLAQLIEQVSRPHLPPVPDQPALPTPLLAAVSKETLPPPKFDLTARELEILGLLAAGCNNKQIAARLVISVRTVETHLTTIYGKLGVNSRNAAMRRGLEYKLVTLPAEETLSE